MEEFQAFSLEVSETVLSISRVAGLECRCSNYTRILLLFTFRNSAVYEALGVHFAIHYKNCAKSVNALCSM